MITLDRILSYLDEEQLAYDFIGKRNLVITGYSSIMNLKPQCISWVKNQSYYKSELLEGQRDILLVVKSDIEINSGYTDEMGLIMCENPKELFFSILSAFFSPSQYPPSIASSAIVEGQIGENVYVGHNTYIGPHVTVGDNVIIKNNVSIEGKVEIGANTIIHSGVIIGSDGFGYYQDNEGKNIKVPHYGGVVIGSRVEIGANVCIDRGTLDDTIIGHNVKIDNLCHIGHNSIIGDNSSVVALSMLGGSSLLEKNVYVAPGVMVRNQLRIGENSLLGMGAVVVKDVEANKVVAGVPAKVIRDQ